MAETNSLLNCRTGNCTGGSNPPLSAKIKIGTIKAPIFILWKAGGLLNPRSGVLRRFALSIIASQSSYLALRLERLFLSKAIKILHNPKIYCTFAVAKVS